MTNFLDYQSQVKVVHGKAHALSHPEQTLGQPDPLAQTHQLPASSHTSKHKGLDNRTAV